MAGSAKTEYVNRTQGFLGAVKINRKQEPEAVPVAPGDRVFLTAEEVQLTEESHAQAKDSPFKLREIIHFDQETGEETAKFTAAPLEKVARARKVAAVA